MTTYILVALLFSVGSGFSYGTLARRFPDYRGLILAGMIAANFLIAPVTASYVF